MPHKIWTMADLMDGPMTVDWIVENVIAPKTTGVIAGKGGIGKTWMTLDLAITMAMRYVGLEKKWLGHFDAKPGKVLIVDEENSDLLLRVRFHKMCEAFSVDWHDLPIYFVISEGVDFTPLKSPNGKVSEPTGFKDICEDMEKVRPTIVIYDSLSRMHTVKEDKSDEMSNVFKWFKKLCVQYGVCNVINHHVIKGNGAAGQDAVRGSGDITNFPDWALTISRSGANKMRVAQVKNRWGEEDLEPFAISFDKKVGVRLVHEEKIKDDDLGGLFYNLCQQEPKERQELLYEASKRGYSDTSADRALSNLVESERLTRRKEGKVVMFYTEDYSYAVPEDQQRNRQFAFKLSVAS